MYSMARLGYFGGVADAKLYSQFSGMYTKFSNEFYLSLEEFRALPLADRRQLIKVNGGLLARFKSAINIQVSRSIDNALIVHTILFLLTLCIGMR